jgi:hypothetical protein
MATGAQHYRRAEQLLDHVDRVGMLGDQKGVYLARAQVHATLALAAAQVEDMESTELRPGWAEIVDGGPS